MAESNVIKEFLVLIGYKHDESAIKKLSEGVGKATKAISVLAIAAAGAAITVATAVLRFSSNLEALYFAAQRTRDSAAHLKAFTTAAQNFGASASEAQGSIEGLTRWLRYTPGGANILDSLLHQVGRSAFDASGNVNDVTKNLEYLGEFFANNIRQGNPQLNPQYAEMMGIDDMTVLAVQAKGFADELEKIQKITSSADYLKATEDAHKLGEAWRITKLEVFQFGMQLYETLTGEAGISLEQFNILLQSHSKEWATAIGGVIGNIWKEFNKFLKWLNSPEGSASLEKFFTDLKQIATDIEAKVIPALEAIATSLKGLNDFSGGLLEKLALITAAFMFLGGPTIAKGLIGLAARLLGLGGGAAATAATAGGAAGGGALLAALGLTGAVGTGVGLGYLINKMFPDGPLARIGNSIGDWYRRNLDQSPEARRQMVYNTLKDSGATPNMAAAMMKVFSAESNMNPGAQGDYNEKTGRYEAYGIGQWHADRQQDFFNQFGHEMQRGTLEEQLQFAMQEKDPGARAALNAMRLMKNQDDMVDVYVRQAERPLDPDREIIRANRMPNFTQSLTFHINEADSAETTADAIRHMIEDENTRMFRNLATPLV